ncbi:MAG: alpha/beta hydrolase [Gemmataceae bacterium]|nr:alpha/beta hydrolase [Gemmataceae bacterium]
MLPILLLSLATFQDPPASLRKPGTPILTPANISTQAVTFKKTPQGDLQLHFFLPPGHDPKGKKPALVFFFGGGWKGGTFQQFVPQAEYLASRGLVAVCADYRIGSIHKTTPDCCVEDAKSAMRWLRGHAGEWGIDQDKIIASGGSAGGHLAACCALVPGWDAPGEDLKISCLPNALVLFNPAVDLKGHRILNAVGEDVSAKISPAAFLNASLPPTLIFMGTEDKLLASSQEFQKKAKGLKRQVRLFTAKGQQHGFFNRSPWTEATTLEMEKFLASFGYLKGKPTLAISKDSPFLIEIGLVEEKGTSSK